MRTMKKYQFLIVALLFPLSGFAQKREPVVLDNYFQQFLFRPGIGNVTGADGVISIPITEDSSLFLWGDSFYGEVENNTRGELSPFISGNAFSLVTKNDARTITAGTPEAPTSLYTTADKDGYRTVMWPEHGFVRDGVLHVFFADIAAFGHGTFDFFWHSLDYLRVSMDDFSVIDSHNFPWKELAGIHFGFSCIEAGDYVYSYGTRMAEGKNRLYLCRFKMTDGCLGNLEFWSYDKWTTDPMLATRLTGNVPNMCEQFSVFRHNDKYILLTQERESKDIYTAIADAPHGPWYNKKLVYTTPESGMKQGWITYNAMAHPQYAKDNRFLVGYCVNTLDIKQLYTDVSSYQPRFFWLDYDYILK